MKICTKTTKLKKIMKIALECKYFTFQKKVDHIELEMKIGIQTTKLKKILNEIWSTTKHYDYSNFTILG